MNLKKTLDYFEKTNTSEVILSDVDVVDKDIGGNHGTDTETANRKIVFKDNGWTLKYDHYKTIQPDFGKTINKELDSYERNLSREDLLSFLHSDDITVKELKVFYKNINN